MQLALPRLTLPVLLTGLLAGPAVAQTTLFVDDTAPPAGDGSSWNLAFQDLQDALDTARVDTRITAIHVAAGLYRADRGTLDATLSFELVDGVQLLGGFPDGGGALASRDPELHPTTLSGDLLGDDGPPTELGSIPNSLDNTHHVLHALELTLATTLDGFRVRSGVASSAPLPRSGGGLLVESGALTVRRCDFELCVAGHSGGALASFDAELRIEACTFASNAAPQFGGGAAILGDAPAEIVDCTFRNNVGGSGAGLAVTSVSAFGPGGVVSLQDTLFQDNRALIGATAGGGLYLTGIGSSAVDCTFLGNTANGGGGAFVRDGAARFETCFFRLNNTEGDGGGAFSATSFSGTLAPPSELISCSMVGNNGAFAAVGLDVNVVNCTVADNTFTPFVFSSPWPAAIAQSANVSITNSIVWGNAPAGSSGDETDHLLDIVGASYTIESSIIQDWAGVLPGSASGLDPLFVDPVGPDGDASTTEDNVYLLHPASPGLDTGAHSVNALSTALDVEGRPRVADGDGNGTARIDLGAYERRSPRPRHPRRVPEPIGAQQHP